MTTTKENSKEEQKIVIQKPKMIGHMDPFLIGNDFSEYEMRLQQFFIVNDVAEEKKVAFFITYIGADAYSVLRKLFSPEDPCKKTYKDLVDALKTYFEPSINEIAESYKFSKAEQGSKSIKEFIVELKSLAQKCNFEIFLDRALRDKFVCGVRDNQLRSKFLKESNLTFKKACEIALNWEMAEGETKEISTKKEHYNTHAVRHMPNNSRGNSKSKNFLNKPCHRCGKTGHALNVIKKGTLLKDVHNGKILKVAIIE